jgi:F0F1-type ATP synthase assembly protein I
MSQRREDGPDDAPPARDPRGEGRFKVGTSAAAYAGVGLQFAATILIFVFAGQWLDRRLGTGWLTLAGAFVGMAAGVYSLYRKLMADQRREEDARRQARERGASGGGGSERGGGGRPPAAP